MANRISLLRKAARQRVAFPFVCMFGGCTFGGGFSFEREFCNFPQNVDFSGARVDNVFRQYNYGGFYERRMQPQL